MYRNLYPFEIAPLTKPNTVKGTDIVKFYNKAQYLKVYCTLNIGILCHLIVLMITIFWPQNSKWQRLIQWSIFGKT